MRAVVLRGTNLVLTELDTPTPGPGEVLARVRACGICGSDLHAAQYLPELMAAMPDMPSPLPDIVMGHEIVAEVVQAGPGAESWAAGTRVLIPAVVPAPEAPDGRLTIGYSPELPGGYAEYVRLPAAFLLPVPAHLPDPVAATMEPAAVALHAVRQAGIVPGAPVLVMGAGPIGLLTLLWLKKEGAGHVTVTDPAAARRGLAAGLGADLVLDPRDPGFRDTLAGMPSPRTVFECVGVEGTIEQAMEIVASRGKVVVAGVCMTEDRVIPMVGTNKHLTVRFVLAYTMEECAETLAALADGSIDPSPLITRTIPLEELPAAFASLANPADCKVLVTP